MAVRIGLNQARARALLPLYIRNQYRPKRALDTILAKVGGGINQRLFYQDYRRIQSHFRWAGLLSKLGPDEVIPKQLYTINYQPHVSRYALRFKVQFQDRDTGERSEGFYTYSTDIRVTGEEAFTAILDFAQMFRPERVEGSRRNREILGYTLAEANEYRQPRRRERRTT